MKISSSILKSMLLATAVAAAAGCNPTTTTTQTSGETQVHEVKSPDTAVIQVPTADPDTVAGPDPDEIPDHYNCPACGMG